MFGRVARNWFKGHMASFVYYEGSKTCPIIMAFSTDPMAALLARLTGNSTTLRW